VLVLREVLVRGKNLLTTIATLRDVTRKTEGYDACDSRHKVHRYHEDEMSILSPELPAGIRACGLNIPGRALRQAPIMGSAGSKI
jgi:hypothetical protein